MRNWLMVMLWAAWTGTWTKKNTKTSEIILSASADAMWAEAWEMCDKTMVQNTIEILQFRWCAFALEYTFNCSEEIKTSKGNYTGPRKWENMPDMLLK